MFLAFNALWCGALVAYLHHNRAPSYLSEAKLLIKYVVAGSSSSAITGPDTTAILRTEMDILTSRDLAQRVVQKVGPDQLAPGATEEEGIAQLHAWLDVHAAGPSSNILRLAFRHQDPQMARKVLDVYVDERYQMHQRMQQRMRDLNRDRHLSRPTRPPFGADFPQIAILQRPSIARETPIMPIWQTIGLVALGLLLSLLLAATTWSFTQRLPRPPSLPPGELATG